MMKKSVFFPLLWVVFFGACCSAFGSGFDNLQMFSAEYSRTFCRNAATDSVDATVYNPAGVMKLENGTYGGLALTYLVKDLTTSFNGNDSNSDDPSYLPGVFVLSKHKQWAGFFTITVVAGGGEVNYAEGSASLMKMMETMGFPLTSPVAHKLTGDSAVMEYRLGGAWAVSDTLSFSTGLRVVDGYRKAKMTLPGLTPEEFEDTATGWGGLFAVNYAPADRWNFGLHYETNVALEYDRKIKSGSLLPKGKYDRDLPALLGLGVSYQIQPDLMLSFSWTYYMNRWADWDHDADMDMDKDYITNSWDLSMALEYKLSEALLLSAGIGRMEPHGSMETADLKSEAPGLSATLFAAGFRYTFRNTIRLNAGASYLKYESDDFMIGDVKDDYKQETPFMCVGIEYKFN